GRRVGIEMDLATLQGEPHTLAAAITAHMPERHAQDIEHEADAEIAASIGGDATRNETLRLENIGWLLDARRHVGSHIVDHRAALEADELVVPKIETEGLRMAGEVPGAAGEIAERGAVLGRDLAEILRAVVAAGARDVLHDHLRLPIDVLGDMPPEYAPLDVGRGAGIEVDQHGQALAFVEGILCKRQRGGGEEAQPNQAKEARDRHGPLFLK